MPRDSATPPPADAGGSEDVLVGLRTPAELIAAVRDARARVAAAEADLLVLAVEWAHAHPAQRGDASWRVAARSHVGSDGVVRDGACESTDLEEVEWHAIPAVAWDAPAAFAAANGLSTAAGKALLRDALVLRHRLSRVYAGATSGRVPLWRARRIAQAALGAPDDVAATLDETLAPIAGTVGAVRLAHELGAAMARLHPEEVELAQLEALEHRHATLDERSLGHTGIADMHLRGDWADLRDFDTALSRVAAALKAQGSSESLDTRRSAAVGVLADPARALALLTGQPAPAPTRQVVAHVHLSAEALEGRDLLATDHTGRTHLEQLVRSWCGRTDTHLVVRPVIDLSDQCRSAHARDRTGAEGPPDPYRPSPLTRERVGLRTPHCVFPHCARAAIDCDLDHVIAHAASGTTCECNLAPLCRQHHQLKTHAGWDYEALTPGTYLWREPHGQRFLTNAHGTADLTDLLART